MIDQTRDFTFIIRPWANPSLVVGGKAFMARPLREELFFAASLIHTLLKKGVEKKKINILFVRMAFEDECPL